MCIDLDGRKPMQNKDLKAILWALLYSSFWHDNERKDHEIYGNAY